MVDDNEANRYILHDHLVELGYFPQIADCGINALKQIEVSSPDLILLDILMPGMSGFDVLEKLKENEKWRLIPVIINSALDDMDKIIKGVELGADDYLIKPCNTQLLNARLKSCLEKKELHDKEIRHRRQLEKANNVIKRQNRLLTTANSTKDKFINIASHDLRSPLSIISLCSELILRRTKPGSSLSDRDYDMLEKIQSTSILMGGILNDFLDYQSIASGKLSIDITNVNLGRLATEVAELYEPLSKDKNISFAYSFETDLPEVSGDAKRIKQVIGNYMGNAIKFSPGNTTVTCYLEQKDDSIRFVIEDEGPGVPKNERDKLFKEFSNISNRPTHNESSSGLGLSIVRNLIEQQNGSTGATFPNKNGSVFWFKLPLAVCQTLNASTPKMKN